MTATVLPGVQRQTAVGQGVRDIAPLALPIIPFAIAIGAATAAAGIPLFAGWLGASLLLAGSANLVLIDALGSGDGLIAAASAAILVNARFALYSAGLAHWFVDLPLRRRLLLAIPLVDQQFLLGQQTFGEAHDVQWRVRYYVTISMVLATTFLAFIPVGYLIGNVVPTGVGLHMAGPLAFAGMLGGALKRRADLVAAAVAALVVVAVSPVLTSAALPAAAIAGVVVGSRVLGREAS